MNRETKYGSKKINHAGMTFSSKLEAAVYDLLWLLQKAGDISNLVTQKRVYFFRDPDIYYIPDFYFERHGNPVFAEAKGFETPEWKIKKKLWEHVGPAPLEIYQGSYTKPRLIETIIPKSYA
jgi:hypothetical protein